MTASAQSITPCGSSDAPAAYWASACDIGGSAPCTVSGSGLSCDYNAVSCDVAPQRNMYAVNYGGGGISAFGGCSVGGVQQFFCCRVDDTAGLITKVSLKGSASDEEPIGFSYGSWNLQPTSSSSTMTATAQRRQGDDIIQGSNSTDPDYEETLYGNLGADLINGNDGDDRLEGGNGDDTLNGGRGQDILLGQNGDDTLEGGPQSDQLHGGDGDDFIEGQAGADSLYGGLGNDELYGGPHNDVLCDSSAYPGPSQCQSYYFQGDGGTDKVHLRAVAFCTTAAIIGGDEDIELLRHAAYDFSAVIGPFGTEESIQTPFPECTALTDLGGF